MKIQSTPEGIKMCFVLIMAIVWIMPSNFNGNTGPVCIASIGKRKYLLKTLCRWRELLIHFIRFRPFVIKNWQIWTGTLGPNWNRQISGKIPVISLTHWICEMFCYRFQVLPRAENRDISTGHFWKKYMVKLERDYPWALQLKKRRLFSSRIY